VARVWGGFWILVPFAALNSALAATVACFNAGTRTWYGMARSGSLPAALAKVNPQHQTPDNAIHLMLGPQFLGGGLCAIFGAEKVFRTWALAVTLGLITMYILANVGVVKYYARAKERSLITHVAFPIFSTVAVLYVGYKSVVPLPEPPARYAIVLFLAYTAAGAAFLAYLKSRGREDWLGKAGVAMQEAERVGEVSAS
jgi:amino acid transporter